MVHDVLDLRAFCLTVDLRSLSAAAKVMGESKATLSRRIARLERFLDVALLRRSPRLVEATEDGLNYRMRIGRVLELLGDANTAVRGAQAMPSGHLRVTAPPEFAGILASHIATFGRRYPEVAVEMVMAQKVLDLDAEHIDVALRMALRLADSTLIAHKLLELEAILIASPEYFKEHPAPERAEDLTGHRMIVLGTTRSQRLVPLHRSEATGELSKLRVRPAIASSDMNFVKEAALAGGGIAFIPSVVVQSELRSGRLMQVLSHLVLTGSALYFLHHGGRFLPPKVHAFRDFMLEAFGAPGRRRLIPK
ncbi:MAG TPA: LysR family transcriptional regulator [Polyangiaceae bacterium]|jgi:DNA-binding transcriptional LysR family regulator